MKWLSKITVFIFHPLFFPLYGMLLFFWVTPLFFPNSYKYWVLFGVLLTGVIIPFVIYAILLSTGWLNSFLKKQDYLVLGYIGIWFLYENKIFKGQSFGGFNMFAYCMMAGYAFVFWFLMRFKRISLQVMGLTSMTVAMICLSIIYKNNYTLLISLLVLVTGWVATAQIYLKKQTLTGILVGWFCGWVPQLIIFYGTGMIKY